ncbi:RBP11-like subunits of RNA polymerase [Cylindrobasidium torrendii FP15055 ss-10]|uniref:RBP11-like subunits of RNA polymerase n=1 Tax=Cylindrobasidium torrendii FP15055 ss-10 TaxID=1314674 RepID=A0A0D7B2J0_9AGAR|nr:RBP11-like subunits of RNA polymerase [Cylindrobasidium torrendii FP15055 ss-10]
MNQPERTEAFVLEDGEQPVTVTEDAKVPNAATFKIVKQDHTLANMVRGQLLQMPEVIFSGYKVPHPLHPYFQIKIQTDGTITAQDALEKACDSLQKLTASIDVKFQREFSMREAEGGMAGGDVTAANVDPYGSTTGWGDNNYADF